MVIAELTVPFLGRFAVNDDMSITDVSLLPSVTEEKIAFLSRVLKQKDSPFDTKKDVILAALSSIYDVVPETVTWNSLNEPELVIEPEFSNE